MRPGSASVASLRPAALGVKAGSGDGVSGLWPDSVSFTTGTSKPAQERRHQSIGRGPQLKCPRLALAVFCPRAAPPAHIQLPKCRPFHHTHTPKMSKDTHIWPSRLGHSNVTTHTTLQSDQSCHSPMPRPPILIPSQPDNGPLSTRAFDVRANFNRCPYSDGVRAAHLCLFRAEVTVSSHPGVGS